MSLSTYKKRSGTSDRGKDYEWLLATYFSLQFCTSPDVTDFQLLTNSELYGDFDDLTLEVTYANGESKIFLLQLKHSEKGKTITLNSLTSESGDFALLKYKKSYENNASSRRFYYILYTNKIAKFRDQTKILIQEEDILIRESTCVGNGLLTTNPNPNCSVFKFESRNQEFEDFFSNFYLYVNQQNDANLKHAISDLLSHKLHCDIYTPFVEFMRGWWSGNFILTKGDVVAKIAELVFSPMLKTLSDEQSNEKTKLIEEATSTCDVTLVEATHKIRKIWTKVRQEFDPKSVSLTALKFGLTTRGISKMDELSDEKKSKVLWYMDEVPLVVEADDSRRQQIESVLGLLGSCDRKKKVILVGLVLDETTKLKFIKSLGDIPTELCQKIAQTFSCSLQGKPPVTLQELGALDVPLSSLIHVRELLEMATTDSFSIGENLETLPPGYIPRSFYKILLNYKVIDDSKKSKILLSCNGRDIPHRKIRKRKQPISDITNSDFFQHHIFVTKTQFKQDVIAKEFKSYVTAHHFRIIDGQNLQWLTSSSNIDELQKYRRVDPNHILGESEIDDHFHDKIRLLISHTGTGKTSFLNRVKNEAPGDRLVIKMNLKEHSEFFKSCEGSSVWDYVIDFTWKSRNYGTFEAQFVRNFNKKKMILLWDGFDDLHDDSRGGFIVAVLNLKKLGITQWITAQNRFQKSLEDKFDVLSMTLRPFSQQEQADYIQKRCGVSEDTILRNFFENMKIIDNQEYLGVPLQLYILTDIFRQDPKLLETVYTLTDIFAAYVDGKYTQYFTNDGGFRNFASLVHRLDQYKIAALRTHLPTLSEQLGLVNSSEFMQDVKKGDYLDLIVKFEEGEGFIFEHQILGEYFCALYLSEKLPSGLDQFIFEEKCRNIRFMFDLLLADKDPVFVSILYKKYTKIYNVDCVVKDKGGRSPLHLICSYGSNHPSEMEGAVIKENEHLKTTVKNLRQICDPYEEDGLFKWTSYDYADRSRSLGLIELLEGNLRIVVAKLQNYNVSTILYYSVMMNYSNLFNSVGSFSYFEDSHGDNLLHVATKFDREKCLTRLMSNQIYLKSINKPNQDNWTPLHLATFNGNLALVKLLLVKGATLKLREPSVLSLAVAKQHREIAEFFLDRGCSPNEFYHTNRFSTSIFQAIDQKLDDVVDLLLRNGAKLLCTNRNDIEILKPDSFSMNVFHMLLENESFAEAEALLKRGIHIDTVDFQERTAFHHAATNNQISVVNFLFARGGDCCVLDKTGQSPLHCAAKAGSSEVAELLIDGGCDFNQRDEDDMTPLHVAVRWGQVAFVTFLVKKGVNPNIKNKHGRTPMHMAAVNNLDECIKILYENGANMEEKESLYGRTPLHFAAWFGQDECVNILLEKGAQVDCRCNFGFTPLHLAVEDWRVESCKILLEAGASVSIINKNGRSPLDLIEKNDFRMCRLMLAHDELPLHSAVRRNDPQFISELVSMGYDVNVVDKNGDTSLHHCLQDRREKQKDTEGMIYKLVELGAKITMQNHYGYTPLHTALQSMFPSESIIKLLINLDKENETVNCVTLRGVTPLHLAAQGVLETATTITRVLLEKGAKVDATDSDGFTALHYAALTGNYDTVKVLIDKGSQVNKLTTSLRTPLHMASTGGHLKVVEHLIHCDASVGFKDCNGNTCFDDALNTEHPTILKVLSDNFDVCTSNQKQRSGLHMAAKQGFLDLVKYWASKVPVDQVDSDGLTPIEEALFNRHYKIVNFLLEMSNFDVNKFSRRYKRYPLHVVACTGNLNLVEEFLKRGARIDVVDEDGNTPLHNAVTSMHQQVAMVLLKYDKSALNLQNKEKQTPLHVAVKFWQQNIVDGLIDSGSDPDLVDANGDTPFDISFKKGFHYQKLLMKTQNFDINKRDPSGKTLLHRAVTQEDEDFIDWLKERGASIDIGDFTGSTPLHYAARGDFKILKLLLNKYKGGLDLNKTNSRGETILHLSASNCISSVAEILKLGASPSIANKYGQTPLHYALKRPQIFKFLWEKKPDGDIFNIAGHRTKTVLHEAASDGDLGVVKFCLNVGFKSNDPDEKGNTPCGEAARGNHLEVLEFLLEQDNKNVDICDSNGWTLLHRAASNGNLDLVKLLVRYGARRDLCNEDGDTAEDLAKRKQHSSVCAFLKDPGKKPQTCAMS